MKTHHWVAQYLVPCVDCGRSTSKKYARAHEGKCKACVTGIPKTKKRGESAEHRNARLIDSGYEAYAREEGYYDIPDNY